MIRRTIAALILTALATSPSLADTARDLSGRMKTDGYTSEWTDQERVFGYNLRAQAPEEAIDDSKWGSSNDVNQIRVTWDANYLYLAVEGKIWGNNVILWIDSVKGSGLSKMTDLTSWRRNFFFDTTGVSRGEGFAPELIAATWDQNLSPHLVVDLGRRQNEKDLVDDEQTGTYFVSAATFDQGNTGRSMELRIPWRSVYLGQANGPGVSDTTITVGGISQTFPLIPKGAVLKIAAAITTGGDGLGGPDVAPDPSSELSNEAGVAVNVDNWAYVALDRNDDTGMGHGGPDGIADWNVPPLTRISFRYPPPIFGLRNCVSKEIEVDRPAFRPDLGERVHFKPALDPVPSPSDPLNALRKVSLSANIYDAQGRFVRNLYLTQSRPVLSPSDANFDSWDGRDERGLMVRPGVYILRLVVEQNICRSTRAIVVVR